MRARITKRAGVSSAHLEIGEGPERTTREIEGTSCDEVVSALGLVIALAVDPRAETARKRPKAPPPEPSPAPLEAPPPLTQPRAPEPPPLQAPWMPPPSSRSPREIDAASGTLYRPAPPEPRWAVGARASVAMAVTPRALVGGGLEAQRALAARWDAALRFALEFAGTGSFDVGPGGAAFVRVIGRVDACALTLRPARRLSLAPCLSAEAGALRGEGILRGALKNVSADTVPWAGVGILPRVTIELGALVVEAQGGPVFPLVRRSFWFERPDHLVYDVPPLTGALSLGASLRFP